MPLLLHLLLGVLAVYWVFAVVRCGEDECIDRPVVAGITGVFWLLGMVVIIGIRGRSGTPAAIRWAAAALWLVIAAAFLLLLSFVAFDIVYD